MINKEILVEETIYLTVAGASQATGGLLSERRIWQLVKEKQITYVSEGDNTGIPMHEFMQFLRNDGPCGSSLAA